MNKIKSKIQFIEPDSVSISHLNNKDIQPVTSRLRISSRHIQTRQTSRSSKVSPDHYHMSRKSSEMILPISEISEQKKQISKSIVKIPLKKKINFTPITSPKLQPKPSHRRIYSDCTANVYNNKVTNEIKVIENKTIKRKISSKNSKSQKIHTLPLKNDKEINTAMENDTGRTDSEKHTLINYLSQYFAQYNECPAASIEFYKVISLIGRGAFGKVLLCEHKLTGKKVAVKAISKAQLRNHRSKKKIFQEVYILRKIKSKYVIKILEVFESEKNFLMVLEYAGGGDLLHYVRDKGRLKEEEAKKIFKQIIQGAIAIHDAGILHRDFKLDNILLDSNYSTIKICDFGISKILCPGEVISDQCGTPAYLAPEIIKNEGYQGFSVDI